MRAAYKRGIMHANSGIFGTRWSSTCRRGWRIIFGSRRAHIQCTQVQPQGRKAHTFPTIILVSVARQNDHTQKPARLWKPSIATRLSRYAHQGFVEKAEMAFLPSVRPRRTQLLRSDSSSLPLLLCTKMKKAFSWLQNTLLCCSKRQNDVLYLL